MSVCTFFVPLQCGNKTNRSTIMAGKIQYIAPVDTVSGMFGKRGHSLSGKAIISNVRRKASQKNPGGLMYFSVLTKTTYKGSANQTEWQNKFGEISRTTRQRLEDPQFMASDLANFKKQTKYVTLYSFVWATVQEEVDGGK